MKRIYQAPECQVIDFDAPEIKTQIIYSSKVGEFSGESANSEEEGI